MAASNHSVEVVAFPDEEYFTEAPYNLLTGSWCDQNDVNPCRCGRP